MAQESRSWTTRSLLAWTTDYFAKKGIEPARLATEMLLAKVLEVDRLKLYMEPDRLASELERAAFRDLVEHAAGGEPVDYLVGKTPFFAMMLKVTPAVLIPRPSTETVVEHVIQHARRTPGFHAPRIADIGSGCGAIAIALAKHIPDSWIVATDITAEALQVARANALLHGVADRITLRQGDLFEPLANERFKYLVSNPPYISDSEWQEVAANVKDHEPTAALRGGADGLDLIRPLIAQAHRHLETPGQLVLEIAASQQHAVIELANAATGLSHPRILMDHEGLPRVLVADNVNDP